MEVSKLKKLDKGYMMLDEEPLTIEEDEVATPTFYIKEEYYFLIRRFCNIEEVAVRGTIFEAEGRYFLCIMFRFKEDDNLIYCQWFSYYDEEDKAKLDKLLFSEYMMIDLVDTQNKEYKCLIIKNAIKFTVKKYAQQCKNGSCTTEEYHRLVEEICEKYDDRADMFEDAEYLG